MKTTAAVAVALLGADAVSAAVPALRAHDGATALSELTHVHHRHHHHHRRSEPEETTLAPRKVAHFGDTRCPCIGFDNIKGETIVKFEDKARTRPAHADCGPILGNPKM